MHLLNRNRTAYRSRARPWVARSTALEPSASEAVKPGLFSVAPAVDTAAVTPKPAVSGWRRMFGALAAAPTASDTEPTELATDNIECAPGGVSKAETVERTNNMPDIEPTAKQVSESVVPSAGDGRFGTSFPSLSEPAFGPTHDLPLAGLARSLNASLPRPGFPRPPAVAPMPSASLLKGLFSSGKKTVAGSDPWEVSPTRRAPLSPSSSSQLGNATALSEALSMCLNPMEEKARAAAEQQNPAAGAWRSLLSTVGERKAATSMPHTGVHDSLSAIFERLLHQKRAPDASSSMPASSLLRRLKRL